MTERVEKLIKSLELAQPVIRERDRRYRGRQKLRYTIDEVKGDLEYFGVNLCRLAVNSVAERMRVKDLRATAGAEDVSGRAYELWVYSGMDQKLQSLLADALALGSAYVTVWVDRNGIPTITPESAEQVITSHNPITGEVTDAVKRWYETDEQGILVREHVVHYGTEEIVRYVRGDAGRLEVERRIDNPLQVCPVVPLINAERLGDVAGHSVIDDMGDLVDALSKVLADMITASEAVARPKRYATGVELEEGGADGFTADELPDEEEILDGYDTARSPFAEGNSMWTVESPDAKFGQLPGADLNGYRTAVDLLVQQIQAVSALPGHMIGVSSSNPASADAIRAAEASLTARAESRLRVLGMGLDRALQILVAIDNGLSPDECGGWIKWSSPATKSTAQETDAVTKLYALGLLDREEARKLIGVDSL